MSGTAIRDGVRYARWIDRHRRAILGASLVVACVAAVLAARLVVIADVSSLLPPTARSVRDLRAIEGRAQAISTTIAVVSSDDPTARTRAARALRDRFRGLAPLGVGVVFDREAEREYAWSHRWLFAELADLEAVRDHMKRTADASNPLYVSLDDEPPRSPDGERRLRERLAEAEAQHAASSELVSADGHLQLVLVRSAFGADDVTRARSLRAVLEAIVADVRAEAPGVTIGLAGEPIVAVAEHDAVLGGMFLATLATALVVLLGLIWYFRSALVIGALGWSLVVATLVTFAFTWIAIGHLNLATAFLASIVIGNGINVQIVVSARYVEELRRGNTATDEPAAALARTLAATFRGTLAAALTAAAAYGSLSITAFDGFRHFGIIGAVGIMACWASAFVVLPAALAIAQRRGLVARRSAPLGRSLARLLPARPNRMVLGGVIACGIAVLAASAYLLRDPFEHDLRRLRSQSAQIDEERHWMEAVETAFGRGIDKAFVIAASSRERARATAARLRAVDADRPAGERLFASVTTLDDVIPRDQARKLAVLGELRALMTPAKLAALDDEERALALRLRPPDDLAMVTDADVPAAIAAPFTEVDGHRGRLILATSGPSYEPWDARDAVRFATNVRALGLADDVSLGGASFMFADVTSAVLRDGPRASMLALCAAILTVLLVVGFNRHGAIAIASGLAGTAAMLACAALFGLHVNFLDFIALPITIGIGIEYAVNIAARERRDKDARTALATTGGAVLVCSFTTMVGYGSLLLSSNMGIRSFGLAALLGELTCVAVAVLVTPAALVWLRRRANARPAIESELAAVELVDVDVAASGEMRLRLRP